MRSVLKQLFVLTVSCAALSAHPGLPLALARADEQKGKVSQGETKAGSEGEDPREKRAFPQGIIAELGNREIWAVVLLAFGFGLVGSFAYELAEERTSKPSPPAASVSEAPPDPPTPKGGFWPRVLLGGFAAVAALYPLRPEGLIGLLGLSLLTGSMGTALFKVLQERVLQLAKTAQLAADLAAKQAALANISQISQEGAARALAPAAEGVTTATAESVVSDAVTLSVIAGVAEAALRSSGGRPGVGNGQRPVDGPSQRGGG